MNSPIIKRLLLSVVLGLSCLSVCYAASVFISWEPNPGKWPDFGRFMFAWIGGAGSIGAGVALYFKEES